MAANRVYFVQHGLAVDKAEDSERPLSKAGVQQTKKMAEALRDSKVPISSIFHSGKLRALQTAEIFASTLSTSPSSTIEGLSPNDDVTLLAQKLGTNEALYIGHLPCLEKLVAYLVTGNENGSITTFKNSAVVCLEKHDAHYQLQWHLTPELL